MRHRPHRSLLAPLLVAALAAAGSWLAAATRPFTVGADLAVSAAFVPAIGTFAVRLGRRPSAPADLVAPPARRIWPWLVVLSVGGAWEVASYLAGLDHNRADYPTLSYFYDSVSHWRAAKAALFFVWLVLGWGLLGP